MSVFVRIVSCSLLLTTSVTRGSEPVSFSKLVGISGAQSMLATHHNSDSLRFACLAPVQGALTDEMRHLFVGTATLNSATFLELGKPFRNLRLHEFDGQLLLVSSRLNPRGGETLFCWDTEKNISFRHTVRPSHILITTRIMDFDGNTARLLLVEHNKDLRVSEVRIITLSRSQESGDTLLFSEQGRAFTFRGHDGLEVLFARNDDSAVLLSCDRPEKPIEIPGFMALAICDDMVNSCERLIGLVEGKRSLCVLGSASDTQLIHFELTRELLQKSMHYLVGSAMTGPSNLRIACVENDGEIEFFELESTSAAATMRNTDFRIPLHNSTRVRFARLGSDVVFFPLDSDYSFPPIL